MKPWSRKKIIGMWIIAPLIFIFAIVWMSLNLLYTTVKFRKEEIVWRRNRREWAVHYHPREAA